MRRDALRRIDADAVRNTRVGHGLTQEAMARRFGVDVRTVKRWEKTGLVLWYGPRPISREDWNRFCRTGSPDNKLPDRK